jgi:hypothetical protein
MIRNTWFFHHLTVSCIGEAKIRWKGFLDHVDSRKPICINIYIGIGRVKLINVPQVRDNLTTTNNEFIDYFCGP